MKPTARAQPGPAHCSGQRNGPEPGTAEAARRHKAPREPRDGVEAELPPGPGSGSVQEPPRGVVDERADTATQGRHGNKMTRAGGNSVGGARPPEVGRPRSRPPGLKSKPPKCEPALSPAPGPDRAPARPGPHLQSPTDRITSPSRPGPGLGPGWGPGRPGGRPGRPPIAALEAHHRLERERLPRTVKKLGASQMNKPPCRRVLRMPALHPEDSLGDAGLDGRGEAARLRRAYAGEERAVLNPTCPRPQTTMSEASPAVGSRERTGPGPSSGARAVGRQGMGTAVRGRPRGRPTSVLTGDRSFSAPFNTAQVNTVKQWVAYYL